jgi:hypothetical protein
MTEHLDLKLEPVQLWKLNYEEDHKDHWFDIDGKVKIYKTENGYQQYVHNHNDDHIDIGIPLQTVGDLMKRYNSMTGHELKYWDKDYPQTAQ